MVCFLNYQCVPKQQKQNSQVMFDHFKRVDAILTNLGITTTEKDIIYKIIASILHLGNIEFECADFGASVKGSTKLHVAIVAQLLGLSPDDLNNALLYRTIEVLGSKIA